MFKFGIQPRIQWTPAGRVTRHSAHSALIPNEQDHTGAICYADIPRATVPSSGGVIGVEVYETTWLRVEGAWSIGFCVGRSV